MKLAPPKIILIAVLLAIFWSGYSVGLRGLMVKVEVEEVKLVGDGEVAKYSMLRK
jgi:hypothetical protein